MNANLFHNILNGVMVILGIVCAMTAADWASFGISAATAATIMSVLAMLKLVVNAIRDGIAGMSKPQPPVQQ